MYPPYEVATIWLLMGAKPPVGFVPTGVLWRYVWQGVEYIYDEWKKTK